jgi:hypothetical protein
MFGLGVVSVCRSVPSIDAFIRVLPCLECEHIFMKMYVLSLNVGEGVCFILHCIDVVRVLLVCG